MRDSGNPSTDDPSTDDPSTDGRYGAFETVDGDLVLYDPENADAWLQSSYAVDVGPQRRSAAD